MVGVVAGTLDLLALDVLETSEKQKSNWVDSRRSKDVLESSLVI